MILLLASPLEWEGIRVTRSERKKIWVHAVSFSLECPKGGSDAPRTMSRSALRFFPSLPAVQGLRETGQLGPLGRSDAGGPSESIAPQHACSIDPPAGRLHPPPSPPFPHPHPD